MGVDDAGTAVYNDTGDDPRCRFCGRRFTTARTHALHLGEAHADELSDADWEAVTNARAAEAADLRRYRLKALIALVVLYFGFLLLYAAVNTGS